MAMNKELHPKSDVDRLYVSRKRVGRGLIECKMCAKAEENGFGWYVKHYIEALIVAVRKSNTVSCENLTIKRINDQILMLMIKPRRWLRWLAWLM